MNSNSVRVIKTLKGIKLFIMCNNADNLTRLSEVSNIISNNFNTEDKTANILKEIEKYGYKDLEISKDILGFMNDFLISPQNNSEISSIDVVINIKNSNIYLKGELNSFITVLKQNLALIFGRHIFSAFGLEIVFNNCIFYDMVLNYTGDTIKLINSKGYIYLTATTGKIIIEDSSVDLYTTNVMLSPSEYSKTSLKQCRIMIPADSPQKAIGKFKGYLLSYNLFVDDFVNQNNIMYYLNPTNNNSSKSLDIEVNLNDECFSTLTHIPTCTSIYLENKHYSNRSKNGIFVLDEKCEYAPTAYTQCLYQNIPKEFDQNYQIINGILNK